VAGAAGQDPRIIMDCCGDSDLIKGIPWRREDEDQPVGAVLVTD
jgi:hypothetical protein